MERLHAYLREHATGDLLPWRCQVAAAERFHLSLAAVEETILEMGLLPARYQRNRQAFTTAQQLQLFRSRVAVIGCGGQSGGTFHGLGKGVRRLASCDVKFKDKADDKSFYTDYRKVLERSGLAAQYSSGDEEDRARPLLLGGRIRGRRCGPGRS